MSSVYEAQFSSLVINKVVIFFCSSLFLSFTLLALWFSLSCRFWRSSGLLVFFSLFDLFLLLFFFLFKEFDKHGLFFGFVKLGLRLFKQEVIAFLLLFLVLLRGVFVNARSEVARIATERNVHHLQEGVHAGDQRFGRRT